MGEASGAIFGQILREHRRAAGLTQQELAECTGLAGRAISDLERGARNRPYRDTVTRLADALGLDGVVRNEFFLAARRHVPPSKTEALPPASDPTRSPRNPSRGPESDAPYNVPVPLSSFVGRERELAEIRRLLSGSSSTCRLLTLTGAPGTGKTRLAIEAALELHNTFPDGVWFVPMAAIADPDLVVPAIAHACRVEESRGQNLYENVAQTLRGKRVLLVLDNFEQLATAAPLVARLLEGCPTLKALVTSRARLRVRGERELVVAPLSLPGPAFGQAGTDDVVSSALQSAAVQLFVERARDVRPDFAVASDNAIAIAEICRRLDGLPLAIELAASRSKILSPAAILSNLRSRLQLLDSGPSDLPGHQQTLRQAIAWSYDLFNPDEQQLFQHLAVFVGGFTLQSAFVLLAPDSVASSVLSGPVRGASEVLRGVEALVDQSLLDRVEAESVPRFRMLETIREFAIERLTASGELEALRRRHAACFLGLAEDAADRFRGPDEAEWIDRLEREHDNLRAALRFLIDSGDVDQALRLGSLLHWLWTIRGYFNDAWAWHEELLALAGGSTNAAEHAGMLRFTARAALHQSDFGVARSRLMESLSISRQIEDRDGIAESLTLWGLIARGQGDYDPARSLFEESLVIFRDLGNRARIGAQLDRIGLIDFFQGDHATACALLEESLAIRRTLDDRMFLGWALHELGRVRHGLGESDAARPLFDESLAIWREQGYREGIANVLASLGDLALDRGDSIAAFPLLSESLGLFRDLGQRGEIAQVLELFSGLAASKRHSDHALRLAEAAAAIRAATGAPIPRDYKSRLDRRLTPARQDLGEQRSALALAEGQAMTMEQAITCALAGRP